MTPNNLYAMAPQRVSNQVRNLAGYHYNHVPEVAKDFFTQAYTISLNRVEIRFLKDWCFDGSRVWQLATVWFDGDPVMIIQNAGHEGDDYTNRFITHVGNFIKMCAHIRGLLPVESSEFINDLVDADQQIEELTNFYGYNLDGHFDRW